MSTPSRYPYGVTDRPRSHAPLEKFPILDPTKYVHFYDDFTSATIAASGVTGWHGDAVGTPVALVVTDAHGGIATTETGNMADDNSCYQWGTNTTVHEIFKLQAGKKCWLRVKFKTEDADKDKFMIGLHIAADDVTGTEPSDQFVFRSGATPDALQFAVGKTNSTEVTASLGTLADDTFVICTAYYDGGGLVYVWRESSDGVVANSGTCVVTSSTAGDLMPDTEMTVGFAIECTDTGADLLSLDFIEVLCER
jgi:hypothetical protein